MTALVAVGLAIGSVVAAKAVPLKHAVKVLPLGIAMGFVELGMVFVTDWRLAVLMLILVGSLDCLWAFCIGYDGLAHQETWP